MNPLQQDLLHSNKRRAAEGGGKQQQQQQQLSSHDSKGGGFYHFNDMRKITSVSSIGFSDSRALSTRQSRNNSGQFGRQRLASYTTLTSDMEDEDDDPDPDGRGRLRLGWCCGGDFYYMFCSNASLRSTAEVLVVTGVIVLMILLELSLFLQYSLLGLVPDTGFLPLLLFPMNPYLAIFSSILGVALASPRLLRNSAVLLAYSLINSLVNFLVANNNVGLPTIQFCVIQTVFIVISIIVMRMYVSHVDYHRDLYYISKSDESQRRAPVIIGVKDGRLVLRHRGDNSMGLFDGDTSFVAQQHQQQSGFFNRMASRQKLESKMLASQHLN